MTCDVLVIGAGVVGCTVARALAGYEADICVLEAGEDAACGASRANSGIVHAGFDAAPGSLKARFNVRGAAMMPGVCRALSVPYRRCGALVIGFDGADEAVLRALLAQGEQNGVPGLRLLSGAQALALEPRLNPAVRLALHAPGSALVSPYELTYALADHAALNGVRFCFGADVSVLRRAGRLWQAETPHGSFAARAVVLCAGMGAQALHNAVSDRPIRLIPRRGQYHLLDRMDPPPFARTVFQCPTRMGKGVLVTPTVHGNLLLGPSAEDIPDGGNTATTAEGLAGVAEKARLTWPALTLSGEITNFAGVRAHEAGGDFLVGAVSGAPGVFEASGIESPGLSAAPAIGEALAAEAARWLGLRARASLLPLPPRPASFHEMNDEAREAAVAADPQYGSVVCRCEVVTEAEIRAAIRRPVGARSVDGVKRRCRAGMGRCQGGFCSPRVMEILAGELGIPLTEVTKNGAGSRMAAGTLADALKEVR